MKELPQEFTLTSLCTPVSMTQLYLLVIVIFERENDCKALVIVIYYTAGRVCL